MIPVQAGNQSYLVWDKQPPPKIEVYNIGNGAAFNIRSVIYGPEATAVADSSTLLGTLTWKHFSNEKENHCTSGRLTQSVSAKGKAFSTPSPGPTRPIGSLT